MFKRIRQRIVEIKAAPERVAQASAPRIQAKLRSDSTTRRGNVPSFAKFGDIPSVAVASGPRVEVTCADWVMRKVDQFGQVRSWVEIVREEAIVAMRRGGQ